MEIGKTLYLTKRFQWRAWLKKNHLKEKEIWLVYYNKASGKPSIPYNDAVEEALCFGWIDSIVKKKEKDCRVQRWSPRRKGSVLSDMNRERIHRMVKAGKMARAGMDAIVHVVKNKRGIRRKFVLEKDIELALREGKAWDNFRKMPLRYRRIRVGWIDSARGRPQFKTRLAYFVKMTSRNKRFGMVQ